MGHESYVYLGRDFLVLFCLLVDKWCLNLPYSLTEPILGANMSEIPVYGKCSVEHLLTCNLLFETMMVRVSQELEIAKTFLYVVSVPIVFWLLRCCTLI